MQPCVGMRKKAEKHASLRIDEMDGMIKSVINFILPIGSTHVRKHDFGKALLCDVCVNVSTHPL